jgi:tetratricopeptide (TPR) repeat protein
VYQAIDNTTGERVALKVLVGSLDVEPARFEREARMLARLDHPRIVRYVAHGTDREGQPYLAMEWLEGETLSDSVKRHGPSLELCLRVGMAVAEALGILHARGAIHRDVKPGNVMLAGAEREVVKLLDFGLARTVDATHALTRTDSLLGTPAYMAPEQAREPASADARADVYSLGAVLFHAVSGRAPYVGQDSITMLLKLLAEDPPRLSEVGVSVPPELEALIASMLDRYVERRPSIDAVLSTLRELSASPSESVRGTPTPAPQDGITTTERRLSCVLLVELAVRAAGEPEHTTEDVADSMQLRKLYAIGERFGATVDRVRPELVALVFRAAGEAKDLALIAARAALEVAATFRDARVIVVSGGDVRSHDTIGGNLAERGLKLLGSARQLPPGVWVDDATAALVESELVAARRGSVFWLSGASAASSVRTLLGKVTPCVGRDREIETIAGVLAECVDESVARVVLVTAPAGFGKSRLRHEVLRRIEREAEGKPERVQIWFARGQLLGQGSAFALLSQLVRDAAGIRESDSLTTQRSQLQRFVRKARVSDFLGEAIGVPFDAERGSPLDVARQNAALLGDQMLQAWEDLVRAVASAGPLLLVLEDVQWGDLPSIRFIDSMLGRLPDSRVMVLAFARPEVHQSFERLWAERGALELRLGPLGKRASEQIVSAALGSDQKPEVIGRIVERAGGNAFFLEELIRACVERGADELPDTVVSSVQTRLDGLEQDARQILRAGSVFGRAFWVDAAAFVLGSSSSPERTREWLRVLAERELVSTAPSSRFAGQAEYVFRHSLVREGVYATLTERDRALAHRRAAEWLERAGEVDARVLAEHHDLGAESGQAIELLARAAVKALAGNDLDAAIAYSERALAKSASSPAEREGQARLAWTKSLAHLWRGENESAALAAESARSQTKAGSELWFRASWVVIAATGRLGDFERLTALGSALASCPVAPDAQLARLMTLSQVAVQGQNAGRWDFSQRILSELPDSSTVASEDPALAAAIDRARGTKAARDGDIGLFLAYTHASVNRLDAAGDVRNAALQRVNLGYAELLLGRYAEAEQYLNEAIATGERLTLHNVIAMAKNNLGLVATRLGRIEDGLRIEREAVAAFVKYRDMRMEGGSRAYLALQLLEAGEVDAAESEAGLVMELAGRLPTMRGFAQAILGGVSLARGDSNGALRVLSEAMNTLEHHGIEDGEIFLRVMYRNALRAAGRDVEAGAAAEATRARVLELAQKISDSELRQGFLTNVPENRDALAT